MRLFETNYAGAWKGYCNTRESAIRAAIDHILNDGYTRATVTNRVTGETVARLALSTDRKAVHVTTITQIRKTR